MKLMLDTCVVIDLLTDAENMNSNIRDILNDYNNQFFASVETMRELVVHFNNKRLLSKYWKAAEDVLRVVEEDLNIEFLPIRRDIGYAYSRLQLNTGQKHNDPSDHIIISHAITERMPLISSDEKFPFYRAQGLDLIEY